MRPIKFRAWDGKEMIDVPVNHSGYTLNEVLDGVNANYKLMQFTGLQDKNGSDCYEKDILTNGAEKRYMRWVGAGFWLVSTEVGKQDIEPVGGIMHNWEIVGNEYELRTES